ncbi:winged helix-turn-helix transcriptional regulator [Kineococcus sp. SYSU DK006]|uniref:winged helix-turn-helix transcriptional regulator n=1 Tax=Kineococcus sp. SYSU DK006 TaxID=3383127 RepID=UPI003D7D3BB2
MAQILVLTNALTPSTEVLPALGLLPHSVRVLPAEASVLVDEPTSDAVLVDGRRELAAARSLCRLLRTTGLSQPLLLVLTEGGMAAVAADWGADDVLLDTCGPAELDARLRLAAGRLRRPAEEGDGAAPTEIRAGDVVIDEAAYSARVRGRQLDLTYKEFELLKHLAQHPGRVFTRAQLLQEVWGYDYFGGTRTVDVHVRRLRAKLGAEHENAIGTVRNVGYRFVSSGREAGAEDGLELDAALTGPAARDEEATARGDEDGAGGAGAPPAGPRPVRSPAPRR